MQIHREGRGNHRRKTLLEREGRQLHGKKEKVAKKTTPVLVEGGRGLFSLPFSKRALAARGKVGRWVLKSQKKEGTALL